jgi:MFS family permease
LLWVVALLNYLDRQVIFSIFPLLQNDLKASSIELGLTSTIFLFTYAVMSPFAGFVADRFGRDRVIIVSLVIWSSTCFLASHVHSMLAMMWTRAGMGVSEAFYIPAALALIVSVHPEGSKSLATGIHQTGCYTGMILGGTLGGLAGQSFSWRQLFGALGLTGVAYSFFLWLAFHLARQRKESPGAGAQLDLKPLFRNGSLMLFTGIFMAYSVATWILYTWLPLFLFEKFNMTLAEAGFEATFWLQTASYVGAFAGGLLADRSIRTSSYGRFWVQLTGLALAAPFLLVLSLTTDRLIMILALISIGVGKGSFDANTTPILERLEDPKLCSTAYGILNSGGCIVGGLGALAGGWLRQQKNFSLLFSLAGVSIALAVLGLYQLTRRPLRPATANDPKRS